MLFFSCLEISRKQLTEVIGVLHRPYPDLAVLGSLRFETSTERVQIFTRDTLQGRQSIAIVFSSTSIVGDNRHVLSDHSLVIQWQASVFWIKETHNHSEIALFYYQTIPHEILRLVDYDSTKTKDGPKSVLIRPCPFRELHDKKT